MLKGSFFYLLFWALLWFHESASARKTTKRSMAEVEHLVQTYQTPQHHTTAPDEKNALLIDDYEAISDWYAYDPDTKNWIQIKYFKIVKNNTSKGYLKIDLTPYANFWAYNSTQKEWHRVTLLKYLQKNNPALTDTHPLNQSPGHSDGLAEETLLQELVGTKQPITTDHPVQHRIWSNFSLHIRLGTGISFYNNRLVNMKVLTQKGSYFFIPEPNNDHKAYQPHWFYNAIDELPEFDSKQVYNVSHGGSNAIFKGKGAAWPITLGVQYKFLKKLFVGIGREIVLNHTSQLLHNDALIENKLLKLAKKWSAQGRWFLQGGWYFFHHTKHSIFGDIGIMYVHHLGGKLRRAIASTSYLHQTYSINPGIGYERKLTDYLSVTSRFSMEWQRFKEFSNQSYNIIYTKPAIYLQIGLAVRAAK